MKRTTVMLPTGLHAKAVKYSRSTGISLGELVRESLSACLSREVAGRKSADPFFSDSAVYTGKTPKDLSERHDHYLYGS